MPKEEEIKFLEVNLDELRKRLEQNKAKFLDKYFEDNQVFDNKARVLKSNGVLLRLRTYNHKHILCLKNPPQKELPKDLKVWEEHESTVGNPEQIRQILAGLGYEVVFCYQKVREKWSLHDCLACLDRLPFGDFLELEGTRESIKKLAEILELNKEEASIKTYHELNLDFRKKLGLPLVESFLFKDFDSLEPIEKQG